MTDESNFSHICDDFFRLLTFLKMTLRYVDLLTAVNIEPGDFVKMLRKHIYCDAVVNKRCSS